MFYKSSLVLLYKYFLGLLINLALDNYYISMYRDNYFIPRFRSIILFFSLIFLIFLLFSNFVLTEYHEMSRVSFIARGYVMDPKKIGIE